MAFRLLLLFSFFLCPCTLFAQEFDSVISIDVSQLSGSDRDYIKGLDQQIKNYIELNKRSDDPTLQQNKIRLNMQFIIETQSFNRSYTGRLFIGASRNIYKSEKETALFRYMDASVKFDYNQGEVLNFNEREFQSLTSLIDFYLYLVLGIDADSYDPMAGNIYFLRAAKIATLNGTTAIPGWSIQPNIMTRKQIIDEFLDPKLMAFRQAFFKYHYDGLDILNYDLMIGYRGMLDGLKIIQETDFNVPNTSWKRRFFEAKSKEIGEVFKDAPYDARLEVLTILGKVDPANTKDYQSLR